jgi:hypothetical protein
MKATKDDVIIITKKVCYGSFHGLIEAEIGKILKVTGRDSTDEGVTTSENIHVWDNLYEIYEGEYLDSEIKGKKTLKPDDIVRSAKQSNTVVPYLIQSIEGDNAKCLNLIDTYNYTIPLEDLYLWIVK